MGIQMKRKYLNKTFIMITIENSSLGFLFIEKIYSALMVNAEILIVMYYYIYLPLHFVLHMSCGAYIRLMDVII